MHKSTLLKYTKKPKTKQTTLKGSKKKEIKKKKNKVELKGSVLFNTKKHPPLS